MLGARGIVAGDDALVNRTKAPRDPAFGGMVPTLRDSRNDVVIRIDAGDRLLL
jgi:hypothetical protein